MDPATSSFLQGPDRRSPHGPGTRGPAGVLLLALLATGCNAILGIDAPVLDPALDEPDSGRPDGGTACAPRETDCHDGIQRTCRADGTWDDPVTCEAGCDGDRCRRVCDPGRHRCGTVPERCAADGRAWEPLATCDIRCLEECGCDEGDTYCDGDTLLICTARGDLEAEVCSGSCVGSAGFAHCGCEPGRQRCDGQTLMRCNDEGAWVEDTVCPEACTEEGCAGGCESGTRECGECAPGTTRCTPGALAEVQVCDREGTWQAGEPCADQACVEGECQGGCTPGAVRCAPDEPATQVCDEAGVWQTRTLCQGPGQVCREAACVANDPHVLGYDDVAGGDWAVYETPPSQVLAIPVRIPRDANLLGLRLHAAPPADEDAGPGVKTGRMALYDSTPEGTPGSLIVATAEFTILEGRNEEAAGASLLGGERYWVAAFFSGATRIYKNSDVDSEVYAYDAPSGDLAEPFPLAIATSVIGETYAFSIIVQDTTP